MTVMRTISKSQYIKGLQCPLALWFARKRKDLKPEIDAATEALFESGHEVGSHAKDYFPGGAEVIADYWDLEKAVRLTEKFIQEGKPAIYEAAAVNSEDGTYCKIDILRRVEGTDEWDLIEVKGSTSVKDYHLDDIAFQCHVFAGAGYRIRKCFLMHINNQYVRDGEINPKEMFHLEDLTEIALQKQGKTRERISALLKMLAAKDPPIVKIGRRCFEPFECGYKNHCWKDVPKYSVFNVYGKAKAEEIALKTGSFDPADIPPHLYPGGAKSVDIISHIKGEPHFDPEELKSFLNLLEYPLYFLDYETVGPAVPYYNQSRPFQQVPFQFSLHIEQKEGAEPDHHEFLHMDSSDPREAFAKSLIDLCGTKGSLVVYNQGFEMGRNRELAELLPHYADSLEALNDRMVDLLIPFRSRWAYHPEQRGSASLKFVLPAFTDLTYSEQEISDGGEASLRYLAFLKGRVPVEETEALWAALREYCRLDTYAMVELLRVLAKK